MNRLTTLALGLAVLLTLAFSGACSGGETHSSTGAPTAPTSEAQALPPELQKMLDNVAAVRELSPPPTLKATFVSRSDLPKLLDSLLTADDRRVFQETTTLYRLLGHLRKDQDYLSVYQSFGSGSVVGLYSPPDKQLWVVANDGQAAGFTNLSREEKSTVAHELVHAVQDNHYDLTAVYKTVADDLDRSLTSTCVIEGDAVTNERLYGDRYLAVPLGRSAVLLASSAAAADVPASIQRELLFPYTAGAQWIADIRQQKGTAPINAMLADPPHGTAYVLHPELLDNGFQPAKVTLPDLAGALGAGWKRESGGAFGEFQLRNYLQLRVRALDASTAAAGWVGDRYDVYANSSDSVALFRLKFRDAGEAAQFASAQDQFLKASGSRQSGASGLTLDETNDGNTTARAARSGDEIIFAIGSSKAVAEIALQALLRG
jgi:hypothetical protein